MSIVTTVICDGCCIDTKDAHSRQEVKAFLEWILTMEEREEDIPGCPCVMIALQLLSEEKVEPFSKPCYTIALEDK